MSFLFPYQDMTRLYLLYLSITIIQLLLKKTNIMLAWVDKRIGCDADFQLVDGLIPNKPSKECLLVGNVS